MKRQGFSDSGHYSEIRNLNVESIDLTKNEIQVLNAKGHEDRDVYLHPEMAKILKGEIDSELRAARCPCCGYGEGGLHGLAPDCRGRLKHRQPAARAPERTAILTFRPVP